MNMDSIDTLSDSQLVDAHKLALRKLRKAERMAVLVPFVLLVIVLTYLWLSIVSFTKEGWPKTLNLVMQRAPEVVQPVLSDTSLSLKRLAPVYGDAILKSWQRDLPIYKRLVESQKDAMLEYAAVMNEKIQARFMALESRLLTDVERHLAPDLVGTDREIFEKTVAKSLYNRLENEVQANWKSHIDSVNAITDGFYAVALKTPPPLKKNTGPYMVGVGFELLGIKIQEASK